MLLAEILSSQRFQEYQTAVSVGQGMEQLHRDPFFVNDDPERTFPDLIPGHPGKRIAVLLTDLRHMRDLLDIIPEHTPAQPCGNGGKPAHRYIQGGFQNLYINFFL